MKYNCQLLLNIYCILLYFSKIYCLHMFQICNFYILWHSIAIFFRPWFRHYKLWKSELTLLPVRMTYNIITVSNWDSSLKFLFFQATIHGIPNLWKEISWKIFFKFPTFQSDFSIRWIRMVRSGILDSNS